MSNITRFDPVNELARFDPFWNIDDMLNGFMLRPIFRSGTGVDMQMKMDLKEADGKYLVKAEIPGVTKDDIQVTVDGNRVSISAEIKQAKESKDEGQVIRSERSYGMVSRSFSLADEIDQNQVQAKYTNEVLELTLPKKAGGSSRKKISIS